MKISRTSSSASSPKPHCLGQALAILKPWVKSYEYVRRTYRIVRSSMNSKSTFFATHTENVTSDQCPPLTTETYPTVM
jgi:hypothetical protein